MFKMIILIVHCNAKHYKEVLILNTFYDHELSIIYEKIKLYYES